MLDDLAYIHRVDKADTLGIAEKEPEQLLHNFASDFSAGPVANVVYAAMGGSALAAALSQTWPGYRVPFEIVRGYDLPNYVSSATLCVVASNSGNTEEALSSLAQAEQKEAQIVVITSGGKLLEIAREKNYPLYVIPQVKQPRYGVFYNLKALVEVSSVYGVSADQNITSLSEAVPFLREKARSWGPSTPIKDNRAKQIALDSLGKSVVIYAGPKMAPAAYKWKISFNENAKQIAWTGTYPEFNHNEFIGWSEQPVNKPYQVIDLRSSFEHPRVLQRFALSERLLSGRRPAPEVVNAEGANILQQLLYCVLLGDFVTLYSAIATGINPEPVELVEKFKDLLKSGEQSSKG